MLVLDANVWVHALVNGGGLGERARHALMADPDVMIPAHAPVEVLRTLARLERAGHLAEARATELARRVALFEVRTVDNEAWVLEEVWSLRHNVSAYDAPYLVLARRFEVPVVTSDVRLARAAEALDVAVVVIS